MAASRKPLTSSTPFLKLVLNGRPDMSADTTLLTSARMFSDHCHTPVDLDLAILYDCFSFHDIRLRGCKGGVCRLNVCHSLLHDSLSVGYGSASRIEVSLCLINLCLERRRINPRYQLALGNLGIEISKQGHNDTGHLRSYLDSDDGVGITCG